MKSIKIFSCVFLIGIILLMISCEKEAKTPQLFKASGSVSETMDAFRLLLGDNNGNVSGLQAGGRREINWDGLPDNVAAPNSYVGTFFNDPVNKQTRGIEFTTPGTGLVVSAKKVNPTNTLPSFGNINASYTSIFPPFSGERIFSPVGSNIADIRFYIPGSSTPAVIKGFGAIYIDVDEDENEAFEFFDINEKSLGKYSTPKLNNGHVFLGVLFDSPLIHHVRIKYGNSPLGPDDGGNIDVSVMDDFIFGEPQLPEY